MKIQLTTTFKQLHEAGACKDRYRHLAKALGGIRQYGRTKPINLLTILEHNGLGDFFWVLEYVLKVLATADTLTTCVLWWTKERWDRESAATREEIVAAIKRLLK